MMITTACCVARPGHGLSLRRSTCAAAPHSRCSLQNRHPPPAYDRLSTAKSLATPQQQSFSAQGSPRHAHSLNRSIQKMHATPGGASMGADQAASSAAPSGMLAAEFGSEALSIIRQAALLASSSSSDTSARSPDKAGAVASKQPDAVLITGQHLLLAVLQLHPEAVQVLGENLAVPWDETAAAVQKIMQLATAGDPAGIANSSSLQLNSSSNEQRLSEGLVRALNTALADTRWQGLSAVTWHALLRGLMMAQPEAHQAYQQLLGCRLYSADIAEQLLAMMEAAAGTAGTAGTGSANSFPSTSSSNRDSSSGATAGSSGAVARDSSTSCPAAAAAADAPLDLAVNGCWMDTVLHAALEAAAQQLAAGQHTAVVTALSGTITSAADNNFRPTNQWLQQAWAVLDSAVSSLAAANVADAVATVPGSLGGSSYAIIAFDDLVAAAHASAVTFKFSSPELAQVVATALPTVPCFVGRGPVYGPIYGTDANALPEATTWLHWVCTVGALYPVTNVPEAVQQHLQQLPDLADPLRDLEQYSSRKDMGPGPNQVGFAQLLVNAFPVLAANKVQDPMLRRCWQARFWSMAEYINKAFKYSLLSSNRRVHVSPTTACDVLVASVTEAAATGPKDDAFGMALELARNMLHALTTAAQSVHTHVSTEQLRAVQAAVSSASALHSTVRSWQYLPLPGDSCLFDAVVQRQLHKGLPATSAAADLLLGIVTDVIKAGTDFTGSNQRLQGTISALAGVRLPAMSLQQLDLLLSCLVQMAGSNDSLVQKWCQQLPDIVMAAVSATSFQAAAADQADSASAEATPGQAARIDAGHVANILRHMQKLPVQLPAKSVQQLVQLLPQLLPLLQPSQYSHVVSFVAQQPLHQMAQDSCAWQAAVCLADTALLANIPNSAAAEAPTSAESTPAAALEAAAPAATASSAAAAALAPGDPATAYCTASEEMIESCAAAVAALLKLLQGKQQQASDPTAGAPDILAGGEVAAQQLCDMAQALGASKLPVDPAVMDVLAAHVGRSLKHFEAHQLAVLAWAFARKLPSAAAASVMRQLVGCVQMAWMRSMFSAEEAAVVRWAVDRLVGAQLITGGVAAGIVPIDWNL